MKKFRVTGVVVLVACFSLVACGSNSHNSPRLTKAEYVAKANTLCRATTSAGNALKAKYKGKIAEEIKAAAGLLEKLQSDLKKLRPPAQMEAGVNTWLASGDEAAASAKALAGEAAHLDLESNPVAILVAPSYSKLASVEKKYNAEAKTLRLTSCVSKGN